MNRAYPVIRSARDGSGELNDRFYRADGWTLALVIEYFEDLLDGFFDHGHVYFFDPYGKSFWGWGR
jgi:hypothetical protein